MRIGILGGTFNPIHSAHVQMARIARDEASLDRVLLMVAADPPHKQVDGAVPASERYRLTEIALAGEERIVPSDLEIRRGGKSYTLLTLQQLREESPGAELFLILGSDMLADLPNWYHPEEVLSLAGVLCVPRIGRNENDGETAAMLQERYGARITMLSAKADMISSTEIRRRLLEGLPTEGWMPEAVEQAVYEGGEYFPADVRALQQKCRAALDEKRYRHVCGTMRAAAELAVLWKQDAKRARSGALLHDCQNVSTHSLRRCSPETKRVSARCIMHSRARCSPEWSMESRTKWFSAPSGCTPRGIGACRPSTRSFTRRT